jgi:hypothetical protein
LEFAASSWVRAIYAAVVKHFARMSSTPGEDFSKEEVFKTFREDDIKVYRP